MVTLFDEHISPESRHHELALGAVLLTGRALEIGPALVAEIDRITVKSPFRRMVTPGGFEMSVEMTNCGPLGWVTDLSGYRYVADDPLTNAPWPRMPELFQRLACESAQEAGFHGFRPDACLINRYQPASRLSLHQDKNESDFKEPIVSVSLGLPAKFQFGGFRRTDPVESFALHHGDVVVWGGPSRLRYHGVAPIRKGFHALTGSYRINLTFRSAS